MKALDSVLLVLRWHARATSEQASARSRYISKRIQKASLSLSLHPSIHATSLPLPVATGAPHARAALASRKRRNDDDDMAAKDAKSPALVEEEDIIRKRFLTQTSVVTTTGPPFNKLVASVRQLEAATGENKSSVTDAVLSDLYSIESYINKLEMMMGAYLKEQDVYREKHAELQSSISGCVASIETCKSELEAARREMAQSKEYEQVKQQIVKIPARSMTLLEIEAVKQEIDELRNQQNAVERLTNERIGQFRSILEHIEQVDRELSGGDGGGGGSRGGNGQEDDVDIDIE